MRKRKKRSRSGLRKENKKKRSGRKKQTAEKKRKVENDKKTEKGMWDWLKELNKGFKEIKENKKG